MLFSIIVPTFNRAFFVKEVIDSVLTQTFTDFELIVIDDGSTDSTPAVLEGIHHPKFRFFRKENGERGVARNYGASKSTGDYLIFLDSDDEMLPNHLTVIHDYITSCSEKPSLIFTGYKVIRKDRTVLDQHTVSGILNQSSLYYGNILGCSPVVIRRELFNECRFNENRRLILFEDWELWLRATGKAELHCIPSATIMMNDHTGRSVLTCPPEQLADKIEFFEQLTGPSLAPKDRSMFLSGLYSYGALHMVMYGGKGKSMGIRFLLKALFVRPTFIFNRRFLGIIKQLLS